MLGRACYVCVTPLLNLVWAVVLMTFYCGQYVVRLPRQLVLVELLKTRCVATNVGLMPLLNDVRAVLRYLSCLRLNMVIAIRGLYTVACCLDSMQFPEPCRSADAALGFCRQAALADCFGCGRYPCLVPYVLLLETLAST